MSQQMLGASPINPVFAAAQHATELAHDSNDALRLRPRANTRPLRYDALATQDFGAYVSGYRAMFGIDMRSPTADVRLAEFCLALPEDQFWRDGESRRLVRRAMAGRLPPAVLENNRRGMQAADWFERLLAARAQVAAELARIERSEAAQSVLDLPRLRDALAGVLQRQSRHTPAVHGPFKGGPTTRPPGPPPPKSGRPPTSTPTGGPPRRGPGVAMVVPPQARTGGPVGGARPCTTSKVVG